MSPHLKNDLFHLLRILQAIGKIEHYSGQYAEEFDFYRAQEQLPFNASLMQLQLAGELTIRLSETLRVKHAHVPWSSIRNVRNRISHDYLGINRLIVWEILRVELPRFKAGLQQIVRSELAEDNFDRGELSAAAGSEYYRFVDFSELN